MLPTSPSATNHRFKVQRVSRLLFVATLRSLTNCKIKNPMTWTAVIFNLKAVTQQYLCFCSNRKYLPFLETTTRLSRHPSDLTLVKTRTSSPSTEKSVGFGKQNTGSCVKRSHMEYEWQPSVNTRSFTSHGQYHHPVMYTRLRAPNSENKVHSCCLASSVAKQMQGNIPRVPLDPTQSHLSFMCLVLWDPDRRPRRGPSCCLVCSSLKAMCCLLTVAYRIAE